MLKTCARSLPHCLWIYLSFGYFCVTSKACHARNFLRPSYLPLQFLKERTSLSFFLSLFCFWLFSIFFFLFLFFYLRHSLPRESFTSISKYIQARLRESRLKDIPYTMKRCKKSEKVFKITFCKLVKRVYIRMIFTKKAGSFFVRRGSSTNRF